MTLVKNFPIIIILILYISAFIMPLIKNRKLIPKISLVIMGIVTIFSMLIFFHVYKNGYFIYRVGHWDAPWGIELKITILEGIMSIVFTGISLIVLWYSLYTIEKEISSKRIPLYYTLCNLLVGALLGIIYTNDLFNAFVFIEISSIGACGIIIVKDKKENMKAALKYLILSSVGSGLVLMGIAFIYAISGNLNMDFINEEIAQNFHLYEKSILISLGLFTAGLGVKSAMFPLHVWLPDAHSNAPSTSSALLSSLVLKAYIILYINILYRVFGGEIISSFPILNIVLILGALGMIFGSISALMQKNIKRIIAYSSVAQMGYIFFGIGIGNKLGLISSIFHIIGHAIIKSNLFLIAGSIMDTSGEKEISKIKGIGKEMPITLGLFTLGAMSMVGIPVLPGFISKFNFALSSIQGEKGYLVVIILLSSLLNALYYLPIVINAYFGEENLKDKVIMGKEKSVSELLPLLALGLLTIAVGIGANGIINTLNTMLVLGK